MIISENGLRFLEKVESKENHVYPDSGGEPTIGIGHLLTNSERKSGKIAIKEGSTGSVEYVKYSNGLTDRQVYFLLRSDLIEVESIINKSVKVSLTQNQYDALVAFVYNIGNQGFIASTLLKKLNAGLLADVPTQLRRWVKDNGKTVQGLINRREYEIQLWNGEWHG